MTQIKNDKKVQAVVYIMISSLFFAGVSFFVRFSGDLPTFEKGFFRNLIALVIAISLIKKEKLHFSDVASFGKMKFLLLRALTGTIAVICNFYAIDNLIVADSAMLNKIGPFSAIIFSFFILSEKVKPFQAICVVIAFIGTLFILKPGPGLFTSFGALVGFTGGVVSGLSYTILRRASKEGIKSGFIVFYFSLISCIVCLLLSIPVFVVPTIPQFLCLMGAGACGAAGQFAITAAYARAPAGDISIFEYSNIVFTAILGMVLLGEIPDWLSIIGYVVIFTASVSELFLIKFNKNRKIKP